MYKDLMSILECPCCKGELNLHVDMEEKEDVVEGYAACGNGHCYAIHRGVLDFGSLEQSGSNSWSEYYKEMDYEELDEAIDGAKSESQLAIQEKLLSDVLSRTDVLKEGYLLDVASGRGMLLRKLLERAGESVHIIATDLSYAVLMNDRVKFRGVPSRAKVSYVACDATRLPFKEKSLDMACTFAGYLNMMTLFEKGIAAASRVLKDNSLLINTLIYMKEDSVGFGEVKKILEDNGLGEMVPHLLKEKVLGLHGKYFRSVVDEISYEGIGEKQEGDLLPYPGAWYANAVVDAIR